MGWQESVNYFAGANLARHSELRTNAKHIVGLLTSPNARFLIFNGESNALLTAPPGEKKLSSTCAFLGYEDVKGLLDLNGPEASAFEANGTATQWAYLGEDEATGTSYFGIEMVAPEDGDESEAAVRKREAIKAFTDGLSRLPPGTAFHGFRPHAFLLPQAEAAMLGTARSVLDWNRSSRFCPACGQRTISEEAGWKRICPKPTAGTDRSKMCPARRSTQSYTHPRIDNSIIVAIVSADGERLMLGRKKRSPPKFFSCVAGFQEPGESIEECVRREAREETGLRLGKVIYHSSQPWPMPSQVMIGCLAVVEGSEEFRPEEDEFEEARWFTRDEIVPAIERARTGEASFLNPNPDVPFLLAPVWAIAHFIIRAWALREVDVLSFDSAPVPAPARM